MDNVLPETKYCTQCKTIKPVTEFYRRRDRPCGYCAKCKPCRNAYHSKYIETVAGRASTRKTGNRHWIKVGKPNSQAPDVKAHRSKIQGKYRMSEKGKRATRSMHLLRAYGITIEQYEGMLEAQNGACAICGDTEPLRGFHLDHCHKTGKVRAVLCSQCNSGLGFYKDSPELFRKAMEYLLFHA